MINIEILIFLRSRHTPKNAAEFFRNFPHAGACWKKTTVCFSITKKLKVPNNFFSTASEDEWMAESVSTIETKLECLIEHLPCNLDTEPQPPSRPLPPTPRDDPRQPHKISTPPSNHHQAANSSGGGSGGSGGQAAPQRNSHVFKPMVRLSLSSPLSNSLVFPNVFPVSNILVKLSSALHQMGYAKCLSAMLSATRYFPNCRYSTLRYIFIYILFYILTFTHVLFYFFHTTLRSHIDQHFQFLSRW